MQKISPKKVIGRQFFSQVVKIVDPILHISVNFGNPTVALSKTYNWEKKPHCATVSLSCVFNVKFVN